MIRALRRRHRLMTVVVGAFSITMLALALGQRSPSQPPDGGNQLSPPPATDGAVVYHLEALSPGSPLEVEIHRPEADTEGLVLAIRSRDPLPYPLGQVYWQADGDWQTLSSEAQGLGPITGRQWARFPLPGMAAEQDGVIVVYSPGHGAVVDGGPLRLAEALAGDAP